MNTKSKTGASAELMLGCIFIYQDIEHHGGKSPQAPFPGHNAKTTKLIGIAPLSKMDEVDAACSALNLRNRQAKINDITYHYERNAPVKIFTDKDTIVL